MPRFQDVVILLTAFHLKCFAVRINAKGALESDSSNFNQAFVAGEELATVSLRERFQTISLLGRRALRSNKSGNPHHFLPIPDPVLERFNDTKALDAGNFGEIWLAHEKETGKTVVLKLFYGTDMETGKKFHLTQNKAKDDAMLMLDLEAAIAECRVAKDMESKAADNPKGASRIMRCYEDHASEGMIYNDAALYLVTEDCAGDGGMNLLKWMQSQVNEGKTKKHPKRYVYSVLGLFKQMIEGLEYISGAGYVHHDIKPENIMVKVGKDGKLWIKIIDFGGIMPTDAESCVRTDLVGSPYYAGPEWFDTEGPNTGFSCANPASFDVYSIAMVLDELITGYNMYEKLRDLHTPPPDENWLGECMQAAGQAQCVNKWSDDLVKLENGSEMNFTSVFFNDDLTDDQKANHLESVLMDTRVIKAALKPVVKVYQEMSRERNWYETFMSMIAFDADTRVSPTAIVNSEILQSSSMLTEIDPDNSGVTKSRKKRSRKRSSKN